MKIVTVGRRVPERGKGVMMHLSAMLASVPRSYNILCSVLSARIGSFTKKKKMTFLFFFHLHVQHFADALNQ